MLWNKEWDRILRIERIVDIEQYVTFSKKRKKLLCTDILICIALRNGMKWSIHIFLCLSDVLFDCSWVGPQYQMNFSLNNFDGISKFL